MSLPPLLTAMLRPEFYPARPAEVTLVQTHISYVLLAGEDVYKLKKPVRFSFLDFSTLAQRRHFCHEEVRLNRRLAPETYRGVVAICRDGTTFRLAPEDAPAAVEYAVHMRRLPAERILAALLDQNQVTLEMIDDLAARLAAFHRQADAGPAVTAGGDPAAIAQVIDDNFAGVRPFRGATVSASDDDAIQRFTRGFLERNAPLLRRRQAEGRIRNCHGDLHSEHVCFGPPLVIFDCIEFNSRFRHCDVASEIAFLAMDLDYHGHPELTARLVTTYAALAEDAELPRLIPFYQCYRAYVRGKVESLKSAESDVDPADREAARRSAARHFALAYRYTWAYSPALAVIAGLSGSGKTTLAAALQQRTGFAHVRSDVVRKRLAGLSPDTPARSPYESGLYHPDISARTYAAMRTRAAEELAAGRGVLLDATFQRRADRDAARDLAARHAVPLLLIECRCDEDEVRRRLALRAGGDDRTSDADWQVYVEQRRRYEPFTAAEDADRLVVDTGLPPSEATAAVERALHARTP